MKENLKDSMTSDFKHIFVEVESFNLAKLEVERVVWIYSIVQFGVSTWLNLAESLMQFLSILENLKFKQLPLGKDKLELNLAESPTGVSTGRNSRIRVSTMAYSAKYKI